MKTLLPVLTLSLLQLAQCNPQIATLTGQMAVFATSQQCGSNAGPDIWLYLNADGSQCVPYGDSAWYVQRIY